MSTLTYRGSSYTLREGESVLDALVRGGAPVSFSCRKGSCQACVLRTEGDPGEGSGRGLRAELVESGHFLPCLARPQGDLAVEPPDLTQLFVSALVAEKASLAGDVLRLRLDPNPRFTWRPGQYLRLRREDGLTRSYSIASIEEQDYFLDLDVQLIEGGAMSGWLRDGLQEGDMVEVQGPLGDCHYRDEFADRPLLLVGTGTGIAPLYGIARAALLPGHRAPIALYYGGRRREDLYLHEPLAELAQRHPNFRYLPCVSRDEPRPGVFHGRAVDAAFAEHPDASGYVVFLCGRPEVVYDARCRAVLAGVLRADIHADPFELTQPFLPDDSRKLADTLPIPELWAVLEDGVRLRAILEDFYSRVFEDPRLAPFFHGVTRERAIDKQYSFLRDVFSGSKEYFGLKPFNAHHWMVISDDLFDYREALFEDCLRRHAVPEDHIRRWAAFHELFRREIVKPAPRGLILDGWEQPIDGHRMESLGVDGLCDGCEGVIPAGTAGRLELRTGAFFCTDCSGRELATSAMAG